MTPAAPATALPSVDALPEFLTVRELAALLRVSPNSVYEAYKRGEIPGGRRVGRSIRFHTATVLEWFRSQGRGSPPSKRGRG